MLCISNKLEETARVCRFIRKNLNNFIKSDAFAKSAIDKIGAGDTLLSLISLCLKKKLDENLSLLIGSIAAALSVKDYGNKRMMSKIEIQKSLENLFK